ncbi:SEL1-like repeat protein [Entomomonas moraniae]|uniref:sel1 repeat family protein n=1 Tax=Entomomonas moraniae TaxID=2213226 RepID=UPI001E58C0C7|nr:sel1 repeat family protein [Entomomonas moraniae]
MYNLAGHYKTGEYERNDEVDHPTAVKKDIDKMVALHYQMVKLEVPLGYYTFAMDINNGYVRDANAALYFGKAVELGYPLALTSRGNYYAFSLPRGEQRYDIAEQYFKCAGKQDNTKALIEVAQFYKIAKGNKALAAYYYQKAASLGSIDGMMVLTNMFLENPAPIFNLGYIPAPEQAAFYVGLDRQLDANKGITFPNLMKDHPLPRRYDADNPDVRPE